MRKSVPLALTLLLLVIVAMIFIYLFLPAWYMFVAAFFAYMATFCHLCSLIMERMSLRASGILGNIAKVLCWCTLAAVLLAVVMLLI